MKRNEQKIENTWKTEDIFKDVMKRFIDGFEEFETIKSEVYLSFAIMMENWMMHPTYYPF